MQGRKIIVTLIQIVLIGIILFSLYRIGSYYFQRQASNKAYSEISNQVEELKSEPVAKASPEEDKEIEKNEDTELANTSKEDNDTELANASKEDNDTELANASKEDNDTEENPKYQEIMTYLQGLNEDVVGYIEVDGTSIAYPIVQGPDNSYYLWRGLDKEENIQGSLFMDYRNNSDFSDKNTVIYGHLMRRGDMFSSLKNFYDQEYTDSSPKTFSIISPQGIIRCRLFSIIEIAASDHDDILFGGQNNWTSHLEMLKTNSQADFSYTESFKESDKIISLSTCVENYDDNYRTVVFAIVEGIEN